MTPDELKAARQGLGLSQNQLARVLGMSANGGFTISRWERGEMEIQHPGILRLALERLADRDAAR